jgi:hypothetical protein
MSLAHDRSPTIEEAPMRPVCIAAAAVMAAGTTLTGGATARAQALVCAQGPARLVEGKV